MDLFQSAPFADHVRKLVEHHHVVGLAIALIQDDEIDSLAFGHASAESSTPFPADSIIPVGSLSKSLTAAAVAQVVSDNVKYPDVKYDTPVTKIIPEDFVIQGGEHDDIALVHILNHRTGMPSHEFALFGPNGKHADSAKSITRNLRNLPTAAQNKTKFIYCNMMYTVASHLLESRTETPFGELLDSRLFQPLQMNSTALFKDGVDAKGRLDCIVPGYIWCPQKQIQTRVKHSDSGPETQGASGIHASTIDFAKWVRALMNRKGPITEAIYQQLTENLTPQDEDEGSNEDLGGSMMHYSFGWDVIHHENYTCFMHKGGELGYQCVQFFIPEFKFGGVMFSNSGHADIVMDQLRHRLIEARVRGQNGEAYTDDTFDTHDLPDDETQPSEEYYFNELLEEVKQAIHPKKSDTPELQQLPLSLYTGNYWNAGYKNFMVEEENGSLIINAHNRSLAFKIEFVHVHAQKGYAAIMHFEMEPSTVIEAEFVLEDGGAVSLGLDLEEEIDGKIWFQRVL